MKVSAARATASTETAVEMDMEITAVMSAVEMDMEMAVATAMVAAQEIRIQPDLSHNASANAQNTA